MAISGTRPSGSILGSRTARHYLPLPPRRQWSDRRGCLASSLASSIRAHGPPSTPLTSPGRSRRLMIPLIPFYLSPPSTGFPNRRISRHRGLTKAFISLRCGIPLPSSTHHLRGREGHHNHLSGLSPCTLYTCRPSCRSMPAITCTGNRVCWKAWNHPPLEIGPENRGTTDTVGDSPKQTPRRVRRHSSRSPPPPPTNDWACPERPMRPRLFLKSLDRRYGDRGGTTPFASCPLLR